MGTASKQEVPEAGRRHSPTPIRYSLRSILDDHNTCSVSGHMRKATRGQSCVSATYRSSRTSRKQPAQCVTSTIGRGNSRLCREQEGRDSDLCLQGRSPAPSAGAHCNNLDSPGTLCLCSGQFTS